MVLNKIIIIIKIIFTALQIKSKQFANSILCVLRLYYDTLIYIFISALMNTILVSRLYSYIKRLYCN